MIRRPRWRRTCGCASSPAEVTAPPVPRLFARTPYGTSVWSRFLFERYACLRPLHRVCGWLSDQGLPVSPGTLADSVHRLAPLFEPVGAAILAHQNGSALRHADETSWRVRALRDSDGSGYAWLWISVGRGAAYFHVDPSRSAEAARKLFDGGAVPDGPRLRPLQRLQEAGASPRGQGHTVVLLGAHAQGLHPVRGRARPSDRLVPGVARADRHGLPPAQGAAGAPRPRPRAPEPGVRRGARRAERGARRHVRGLRTPTRPPVAKGEGREGRCARSSTTARG